MERIDAADLAEKVLCRVGVKLVERQRFLPCQQFKISLMHLHHQRVLAATDRTIASGEFGKVCGNSEHHRTAVTIAIEALSFSGVHSGTCIGQRDANNFSGIALGHSAGECSAAYRISHSAQLALAGECESVFAQYPFRCGITHYHFGNESLVLGNFRQRQ